MPRRQTSTYGFARTSKLLEQRIRQAGETRGFAVSRLLTHWDEIVGTDIAAVARPVDVKYGRGQLGAVLTVLTTGAQAPLLEMQKDRLREKVNACYGYNAIARIRITQTAPQGFADGQAVFHARPKAAPAEPDPRTMAQASETARGVTDPDLRAALEALGRNVLSKSRD